jgi:hypothetical protein
MGDLELARCDLGEGMVNEIGLMLQQILNQMAGYE